MKKGTVLSGIHLFHQGSCHRLASLAIDDAMSLFRVYVDGALFYHPQMSKLAITDARIEEDAENIDSMTLSAPFNHPYLSAVRPLASTIVCKKGDAVVFEGRALDNGIVKSGMSTDRDSDDSNCPVSGECPKNDNPTNYP